MLGWSRLEPLPATPDLELGLRGSLADPLWLLARQWQFGELHGDDAGSPVEVRLAGQQAEPSRYLAGHLDATAAARAVDFASLAAPLEPVVEAEPFRAGSERLRSEAGLHFLRLLHAGELSRFRARYMTHYAPPASTSPLDRAAAARQRLLGGRVPDGAALAADLETQAAPDGTLTGLPAQPSIPAVDREAVRAVAETWLRWWRTQVYEPGRPAAWDPSHLEYALAVQADLGGTPLVLAADEYAGGRLDWYSFDLVPGAALGPASSPPAVTEISAVTLPTRASYPGMPADRLWQFEDARVFLGRVDAGPTDLGRMLLVEFALAFGNDWFVSPVDVPAGSVFRLTRLAVRDTFGVETVVPPSQDVAGQRWTMFSTAPTGSSAGAAADLEVFFLPPTLASTLESDPIEEVAIFRDEMANLAWGVERVVAGSTGEPVDRVHEVGRVSLRQEMPTDLEDAQMVYRLMTPVPDHWIPLVPVPAAGVPVAAGAVELQRASILRFRADGTSDEAQPLGMLLRSDPTLAVEDDVLRIADEEVPRSGVVVRRIIQLARTPGGGTVVWLGRDKKTGRGEGASGMRFDTADPAG
ncbi:MAG: hypothetical protein ACXWWR_08650 [Candidatus Limnocylindrales bacterium]